MTKEEYAVSLRNRGYNCAQAVVCAFSEEIGMDEKELFRLSECFGSGLGCTLGTCGALNGACMVISYLSSSAHLDHPDSKGRTYMNERKTVQEFEKEAGALQCRVIKGIETGEVLCECEDCVRIATGLCEKWIQENSRQDSFLL